MPSVSLASTGAPFLQQINHDLSVPTTAVVQCLPDLCSGPHQLLCEVSVALGSGAFSNYVHCSGANT